MKQTSEFLPGIIMGIYFLLVVILFNRMSLKALFSSIGIGAIVYSGTDSVLYAAIGAIVMLFIVTTFIPGPIIKSEGFNTQTPPIEISELLRKVSKDKSNSVTDTIMKNGYNIPGFGISGPFVEGFEDAKEEKPAPADKVEIKKDAMPLPFTLGEIPAQVKNGPHIDAGSTLIKAIQSLNPEQIQAMTKDTQQLIETQKSLMGMLGTMKPMLNDGKQLMETFQQMFGQ